MKILFVILSVMYITAAQAQGIYSPGKVTKGDSAAYYCKKAMSIILEVGNTQNVDTSYTMYYKDGRVFDDENFAVPLKHSQENLLAVFKDFLTQEEWEKLKGKNSFLLLIEITANTSGKAEEIIFKFRETDPVMTHMPPDRLYELEKRLKKVLELHPRAYFSQFKKIKYFDSIRYKNIAPFDKKTNDT